MALQPAGTDTPHMNFTGKVAGVGEGGGGRESRSRARGPQYSSEASPPTHLPFCRDQPGLSRWASSPMNGQWDGVSHKYTPPLRKHLLNGIQSCMFLCRLNQILSRKAAPGMRGWRSSQGYPVSLRNSGCLLKAVLHPQLQGGRLESSGSLSSYRGTPFFSRRATW